MLDKRNKQVLGTIGKMHMKKEQGIEEPDDYRL